MFIKSTPNQIEDPPVQDRRSRTSDSSGLKYKNNWKLTTASLTNKLIKPWIRFKLVLFIIICLDLFQIRASSSVPLTV